VKALGTLVLAAACSPLTTTAHAPEPSPPVVVTPEASTLSVAPAAVEATPATEPRWVWVMPVDHGIRADRGGAGGFLAPRAHGSHNGLDLVAPVGTPTQAPCAGQARAGKNSSHGKWVQLVCALPRSLGLADSRRISLFFAHLNDTSGLGEEPRPVPAGSVIGSVGKTGNASAQVIAAHLHLEISVHDDEERALAERHSGRDQGDSSAAHELDAVMRRRCLEPSGLTPKSDRLWRARRVDPFVLLMCVSAHKPSYTRPSGSLAEASYAWSTEYSATRFDVDREFWQPDARAALPAKSR
jgi:murein DD-endopeptidase MepM/ murein hydrolase activator NlpD